jgi:hypothetical protein
VPRQKLRRDLLNHVARGQRLGVRAGGLLDGSRVFAAGDLKVGLAGKVAGILQADFRRSADRKLPGPAAEAVTKSPRGLPARENLQIQATHVAVWNLPPGNAGLEVFDRLDGQCL